MWSASNILCPGQTLAQSGCLCDSEAAKPDDLVSIWCFWDLSLTDSPGLPLPPPPQAWFSGAKQYPPVQGVRRLSAKHFSCRMLAAQRRISVRPHVVSRVVCPFPSGTAQELHWERSMLALQRIPSVWLVICLLVELSSIFCVFCFRPDLQGQGQCCGGCKGSCASTCAETVVVTKASSWCPSGKGTRKGCIKMVQLGRSTIPLTRSAPHTSNGLRGNVCAWVAGQARNR